MIKKKFGIDFNSHGGALTLPVSAVSREHVECGVHELIHSDGWKIKGQVWEDYYTWVNEFSAEHPVLGKVWGDFEKEVYADSEEGFKDFYEQHPPIDWDYRDI